MLLNNLFAQSSSGGGGIEVGQLVSGFFAGNPKYVPANGSRYLLSAYPDMASVLQNGGLPTVNEPVTVDTTSFLGQIDATTWREMGLFTDGDVIFAPQTPANQQVGYLLNVSLDGGQTWLPRLPRSYLVSYLMPEFANASLTHTSQILSICKLNDPGHYGAAIATTNSSGNVLYIYTEDYGVTWKGFQGIRNSVNVSASNAVSIYYRNGVLLAIGPAWAHYSTDDGATWVQLTDATWTTANVYQYHQLTDDGYIIHTNQTTSVVYFQWPATPAGWSSNLAFTTVASKLPAGRSYLKKCGNYWIAFSAASSVVYIAESLLGTYVSTTLSGSIGIRDVEILGDKFVWISNTSTGFNLMYSNTGSGITVSSSFVAIDNTATPSFLNGSAVARWPFLSTRFPIPMAGSSVILFRHGRESLSKLLSPTGADNIQHLVTATPTSQMPQFCRKYGMWFCSILPFNATTSNTPIANVDLGTRVLHYRSVDGKNWTGIGVGFGGIIDAGSRLLKLDHVGKLLQSTDGITWDTTGLALPSTGTTNAARLWRCKDVIYYYGSTATTSYSNGFLFASVNGGNTWVSVMGIASPGMMALAKGSTYYYQGKYYVCFGYYSSGPTQVVPGNAETFVVYESADGFNFTQVYSTSISTSSYTPAKVFMINYRGLMWVYAGSMSGSNQNIVFVTGNGRTYTNGNGSTFSDSGFESARVNDVDCSNGDLRWMFDETLTVNSTTYRALRVYKQDVLEATILFFDGGSSVYIHSVGGADGYLMGVNNGGAFVYTPESLAFFVPTPNSGTSPMASPFLRVAA